MASIINKATVDRIKELAKRKKYAYRHIQLIVEQEGLGRPALSFIYKVANQKKP